MREASNLINGPMVMVANGWLRARTGILYCSVVDDDDDDSDDDDNDRNNDDSMMLMMVMVTVTWTMMMMMMIIMITSMMFVIIVLIRLTLRMAVISKTLVLTIYFVQLRLQHVLTGMTLNTLLCTAALCEN